MVKFLRSQLARKMTIYVILISTFFALFSSTLQIYSEYKKEVDIVYSGLEQIERTHMANLTSQVWLLESEGLLITAVGLLDLPNINYIAIYSGQDILLERGNDNSENTIVKNFPLTHIHNGESKLIGKMVIKATLDDIYQNVIDRALLIVFINTVKTFIVSLLILFVFYFLISRHLNDIANFVQQMDINHFESKFSYRRRPNSAKSQDELDILNTTFFKMLNKLNAITIELEETINSMVDAVVVIGEDCKILTFNPAAEKLFGYSYAEVKGKSVITLIPDYHANNHGDYVNSYFTGAPEKVENKRRDLTGQHKNQTAFPIRLSVAVLPRDAQGKLRFVSTIQDLTLVRQQEEQIRRTQKLDALGKLSSGIAHDNNNILGVVLGYSELLENSLQEHPKWQKYANQINHAAQRGAKLTNKLLSFTRKKAYECNSVQINELLRQQKDMLQKLVTIKIKLIYELPDNIWPIWVDENDLEDALINLSINAMHAMENVEAATLVIKTANHEFNKKQAAEKNVKEGEYIQISLTDNGCGIDEDTKEKMFDPFFSTKGELGTGLGLSQVFAFVKRSSGGVTAKSSPDKGTCFELYIPRYIDNKKLMQPNITKILPLQGSETILIMDDEQLVRNLCRDILTLQGYKTLVAENSQQVFNILKQQKIDVLLTDIVMSDVDGYQLSHMVQNLYPQIKIQLMTGFDGSKNQKLVNKSNKNNILHKPFRAVELCKYIHTLLNSK